MNKIPWLVILILILIPTTAYAQEACNGPDCPTETPYPTDTKAPTDTPRRTPTPTYTEQPPTDTPVPTTDVPTATQTETPTAQVSSTPTYTQTPTDSPQVTKGATKTMWSYPTRTKPPRLPESGFGPPEEEGISYTQAVILGVALGTLAGGILGIILLILDSRRQ